MNKNLILLSSFVALVGCGSSSGSKKVDLANYLPSINMSKDYIQVTKINGKLDNRAYTDDVVVVSNLITIKEDANKSRVLTINPDEVVTKYNNDGNHSKIVKRKFSEGDSVSNYITKDETEALKIGSQKIGEKHTKKEEKCIFDSIINRYEKFYFEYKNYDDKHDIIKIKCTTKTIIKTKIDKKYIDSVAYTNGTVESKDDISYVYMQKGLGTIATINDDCLASKSPDIVDDTLNPEDCVEERYEYNLYQPSY